MTYAKRMLRLYDKVLIQRAKIRKDIAIFGKPNNEQEEIVLGNLKDELEILLLAEGQIEDMCNANYGSDWLNVLREKENENN